MFDKLLEKTIIAEEVSPKRVFFYDTEFIEYPTSIDLISIGVVDDQDNDFYAVSNEFDYEKAKADDWLRDNVLSKLPDESEWKSREQIKNELLEFLNPSEDEPVELWSNYPAYDHVVLCWLFGRMGDLPEGMPKKTNCVQQLAEELDRVDDLPPDSDDEHDALVDARWVKQAYNILRGSKNNV
jgi:hypothetical protein